MDGSLKTSGAIASMDGISLEEMGAVKLMNRIDMKYVTTEGMALEIFADAAAMGYRACEIEGEKITSYHSMYYDTPDLEMFRIHRSGRKVRQKIRVRTYLVSGITFLEIKRKNNKGRTKKKRMRVPDGYSLESRQMAEAADFIEQQSWYSLSDVSPACTTDFDRVTLVNKEMTERITFDSSLAFTNPRTGRSANLGDTVIIELKQDGRADSSMRKILLDHRVHPFKVSKYCIGTVLTDQSVHPGRFKEKIRGIEKITGIIINNRP